MFDTISALHPAVETLPLQLAALPLDPASIFVYVLLIVAGVATWWGSHRKDGGDDAGSGEGQPR